MLRVSDISTIPSCLRHVKWYITAFWLSSTPRHKSLEFLFFHSMKMLPSNESTSFLCSLFLTSLFLLLLNLMRLHLFHLSLHVPPHPFSKLFHNDSWRSFFLSDMNKPLSAAKGERFPFLCFSDLRF